RFCNILLMVFPARKGSTYKVASTWVSNKRRKTRLKGPPKYNQRSNAKDIPSTSSSYQTNVPHERDNFTSMLSDNEVDTPDMEQQKKGRYELGKKKELGHWDRYNTEFLKLYAQKLDFAPECCCFCEEVFPAGYIWCKSCGPITYYCYDCATKIHQNIPFHNLLEVKVDGTVEPFKVASVLSTSQHTLKCTTSYSRILTVISETGAHNQCLVHFCGCKDEFTSLLHLDLWPVTPIKPNTVVSINLMHLFVALQLESKISFASFCEGLSWKTGVIDLDLKRFLNRMWQTDSLDQFRNFRRQLINLKTVCSDYHGLEKCASCPTESGSVFYCFDANFGLVLKNSSSKSKRLATRSDNLFFLDEEVKTFMDGYDDSLKTKDCSNFQAGNNLRSKRKTNKLSVTGIFGMSCRHEFPKLFLNMRHGERLGYAVMILDQILKDVKDKDLSVHIIYDIACVLKAHLQKKKTYTKYKNFKFGIPVFHSYGHRGDCQVKNSIRRLDSFGLMDGELMERLWSYLRSFSKVTKEMTPAHRMDLLSDALMHFGSKKMGNIGKHLVFLHQKANETIKSCESEIQSLCSNLSVDVNEDVLKSWKREEDDAVSHKVEEKQRDSGWKELYYLKLKDYYKESALVLISEKVNDAVLHQRKANRLQGSLTSFEKKHSIVKRWSTADADFRSEHAKYLSDKCNETVSTLYSRCSERLMLLALKKRYADGSSIAERLSKQINKVCKEIKNLLASYNSMNHEMSSGFKNVEYIEALNVKSSMYNAVNFVFQRQSSNVPTIVIKSLVQFYVRKQRAMEEVLIIRQEMEDTICYWKQQL
uniref:CxC2-like cysteine cluster KDZ transposase-associated domain-containing protein n=1 Tax=Clytia hemisphaerica TaxID=252671 RepID=A0A7M5X5P9_9CNID